MLDHELELIAALVEGRLGDESEARALIASSPELQEEYEAQRIAYETLRAAPTVAMSETERAALHRDVWTALRADSPMARTRRAPWYYRWTPVAAGLFVLVGLVAVVNQAGDGGSGESARLAADMPVETTAADATAEGDDGGQAPAVEEDSNDGEDATVTTAAASAETTEAMSEGSDLLSAGETAFYASEAESLREGDVDGAALQSYDEDATRAELETCLDDAGLPGYEVLETLTGSLDHTDDEAASDVSRLIAAIPEDADLATAPIAFVDLIDCVLVHLDE